MITFLGWEVRTPHGVTLINGYDKQVNGKTVHVKLGQHEAHILKRFIKGRLKPRYAGRC